MSQDVLVFGGAGYIGAHCCKALSAAGFRPTVFDDLSCGHRDFVRWGALIKGDIRDADAVAAAFAQVRPAAIMHFAASTYVGESVADPLKYYENNVAGLLRVLQAAAEQGAPKVVFSSTAAVYGQPDVTPIPEDAPKTPINPYGRTKLTCEWMIRDLCAAAGGAFVALRYFNASGADAGGEIGEDHDPEPHLVPRVVLKGQGHDLDLKVFGTDYDTPDGTALRDYVHVEDLAEAHVAALRRLLEGGGSTAVNIGTGEGISVMEIIRAVEGVAGRPVSHELGPRRQGDPARLVADPSLARDVLGFVATRSDVENIVRTAWDWHLKRHPLSADAAEGA